MGTTPSRRLFSRGEWLILIGMVTVVIGAMLSWGPSHALPPELQGIRALSVSIRDVSGFDVRMGWLRAGWAAVTLAVVCGSLLLLDPTDATKRSMQGVHLMAAGSIAVVGMLYVGLHAGVIATLAGSAILGWGGFVRYR